MFCHFPHMDSLVTYTLHRIYLENGGVIFLLSTKTVSDVSAPHVYASSLKEKEWTNERQRCYYDNVFKVL